MGLLSFIKKRLGYVAPQQNVFTDRVNPQLQAKFYREQEDPRKVFTKQALNVRDNVRELPRGIATAIQAPQINRVQQKIDLQNEETRKHIMLRIRREPDPLKRQKLSKILQGVQTPNVLEAVNPEAMTEGYAKRVGGTFFDTATAVATPVVGLGKGALAKIAAKGALQKLAAYSALRAAEGAVYKGGRDLAIDRKVDPKAIINTALLSAVGNAALSPKLTAGAGKDVIKNLVRSVTPNPVTGRLSVQPGFAKIPGKAGQTVEPSQTAKAQPQPQTSPIPPLTQETSSFGQTLPDTRINVNKLNISDRARGRVDKAIEEVKPQIEAKIGTRLSNKEAIKLADNSSKTLTAAVGREQTKQWEAAMLKTRQQLAASAKSNTLDKAFIENLKTVKTLATDTARKLQSFSISADPLKATPKQAILEGILKVEADTDKILRAARGVDFNDANQATNFYRQFVKPTTGEWADLLRYNSMLSSPLTHIKNISSNALQVGFVKPVEKTLTGVVDIFSKKRTSFAGEGLAYAKGSASELGSAVRKFADVMSGKAGFTNLDLRYIPTSTGKGTKVLSFPTKMLEGMDQFFTTLAAGGEKATLQLKQSKGIKIGGDINELAREKAAYTVFRGELGDTQQGYLLDGIDKLTGLVERARNSESPLIKTIAKFTLPFVKTPTNIFKQGIEYSPAGFLTTIGAKNITEQVSKALIGSAVFGGAATLLGSGRLTWAEPTYEKQKNEFRAAGMQPYAVKIGDKWVSFKYLGPLSFPLAMVAAIDYEVRQGRMDDTTSERILGGIARYGEFLADQSYAKGIGDLLNAVGGDESGIARVVSNYPQQLIPFRALGGWMARLTDPNQRKISKDAGFIEKQVQLLMQNIPGLSQNLEARVDASGNPIPNQNRVFNAFSPLTVTTENPLGKEIYQAGEDKRAENRQKTAKSITNRFEVSEDAPDNLSQTAALYVKGLIKDPGNTLQAIFTKERLRKITGNAAVFERNQGLSDLDSGAETVVDHIVPLSLGGSNNRNNLRIISAADNQAKAKEEVRLGKLLKEGKITKKQAQAELSKWAGGNTTTITTVDKLEEQAEKVDKIKIVKEKAPKKAAKAKKAKKASKGKTIKISRGSTSRPKLSVKVARYNAPNPKVTARKVKLTSPVTPGKRPTAKGGAGLRAIGGRKVKIRR